MKTLIVLLSILTVTSSPAHAENTVCRGWLYRTNGNGMDRATGISANSPGYIASLEVSGNGGFIFKISPNQSGGMDLSIERETTGNNTVVLGDAENAESIRVRVDQNFNAAILCEQQ